MNIFGKYYSWVSVTVVTTIILVIAYYLGSRTGKGKAGAADSEALAKEIEKGSLTYELSQYETYSQRLYMALYGVFAHKDEINAVFTKMRTKSDVLQLVLTFSKRGSWLQLGEKTLPEWLYFMLDKDEISAINDILQRNAITYEF